MKTKQEIREEFQRELNHIVDNGLSKDSSDNLRSLLEVAFDYKN